MFEPGDKAMCVLSESWRSLISGELTTGPKYGETVTINFISGTVDTDQGTFQLLNLNGYGPGNYLSLYFVKINPKKEHKTIRTNVLPEEWRKLYANT